METLFIGQELLTFSSLDSTNTYLKKLCRDKNRAEGLTVRTEYQTLGRGQFGNSWEAEKGKNLLMSTLLKPSFLEPNKQFHLNMSVCLAVADSLNQLCPGFQVKWPNDILFDRKKVGGILIENSLAGDAIDYSIIGIGLNVNQSDFLDNARRTSLFNILGNETPIEFLMESLLNKLEAYYLSLRVQKQGLYKNYYSLLYGYNEEVPVQVDNDKGKVRITGVEPSGKLITVIRGEIKKFDFKEIRFLLD